MKELVVGKQKNLTVPDGATQLFITHEWGDIVLPTTAVSGTYDFTPDSIGVHKLRWLDGSGVVRTDFYEAIVKVISSTDFFADNEDLEEFEDDFPKLERQVRKTIQNYTGDKFGPYIDKTLEVQGDGGDGLYLPVRVMALTSIENNYGDEMMEMVEISPNDRNFIQRHSRFRGTNYYDAKSDVTFHNYNMFNENYIFSIHGNFGWEYVPNEVTQAASILIADMIGSDDVAEMRQKGVFETKLGDFSLRLNADQWGSTGNTVADNLLAEYVKFGIGLI